jgi:LuxR family maltose regulon positive regulatory protein
LVDLCDYRHSPDESGGETDGLIIALDDFHTIKDPTIHELVSELVVYLPQCVHLALSTRTDPLMPLAGLRARSELIELRTNDLQLTSEEARTLLELTAGRKLSNDVIDLLRDKTEGWVSGLRLAALSIRNLPDDRDFAQNLEGTNSSIIADYLMSEVLSQQTAVCDVINCGTDRQLERREVFTIGYNSFGGQNDG